MKLIEDRSDIQIDLISADEAVAQLQNVAARHAHDPLVEPKATDSPRAPASRRPILHSGGDGWDPSV
jgi:hypothetical protein